MYCYIKLQRFVVGAKNTLVLLLLLECTAGPILLMQTTVVKLSQCGI